MDITPSGDQDLDFQTRHQTLLQTPRSSMELIRSKDRQIVELEVLAAERLVEIRQLEQSSTENTRQMELLLTDRDWLYTRVEQLTGQVQFLVL